MKVSVIVPVYNAEKYLSECVESIINQTYKDIEAIFVDDGSTDNSCNILNEYKAKDDRIIVIKSQNSGASGARNSALEVATGDYITFVDADDYINVNFIKTMLDNMEDADLIECGYTRGDKPVNCSGRLEYAFDESYSFLSEVFSAHVWAKVYKKSILIDSQKQPLEFYTSLKMGEDTLFNVMATVNAKKVIRIPDNLYYYRVTENSVSRQKDYFNEYTKIESFEQIIREVKNTGYQTPLYTAKQKYFFFLKDMYENMQNNSNLYKSQLLGIRNRVKKFKKQIKSMKFGKKVNAEFLRIRLGWRI